MEALLPCETQETNLSFSAKEQTPKRCLSFFAQMRDLHNIVVCGTNATEPSTEADAPAESKLARGRYQANLSFSAKDGRAVRTEIFFCFV